MEDVLVAVNDPSNRGKTGPWVFTQQLLKLKKKQSMREDWEQGVIDSTLIVRHLSLQG